MTQLVDIGPSEHDADPAVLREPRTIRVGLLGCGRVGSAFARLCAAPPDWLVESTVRLEIVQALVRDARRPRPDAPENIHRIDDANAFLAGSYDIVVEALGGIEAPRSLVVRLLRGGVPVVSANKALIADCGTELQRLACENNVDLRFEAAAIPGVPFLDAIAEPAFAARQREVVGILNGTSQFILTALESKSAGFQTVLKRAVERGFCEPDPAFDVDALDAANKLTVILQQLGIAGVTPGRIERRSLSVVSRDVVTSAAQLGGCIRQVALARWSPEGAQAYAGPAWIDGGSPLAILGARENGVIFRNDSGGTTTFAGVGAGPDVTARCLIDDVMRVVVGVGAPQNAYPLASKQHTGAVGSLTTAWFVTIPVRNGVVRTGPLAELFSMHEVQFRRTAFIEGASTERMMIGITRACEKSQIDAAVAALRAATGAETTALPCVGEGADAE